MYVVCKNWTRGYRSPPKEESTLKTWAWRGECFSRRRPTQSGQCCYAFNRGQKVLTIFFVWKWRPFKVSKKRREFATANWRSLCSVFIKHAILVILTFHNNLKIPAPSFTYVRSTYQKFLKLKNYIEKFRVQWFFFLFGFLSGYKCRVAGRRAAVREWLLRLLYAGLVSRLGDV